MTGEVRDRRILATAGQGTGDSKAEGGGPLRRHPGWGTRGQEGGVQGEAALRENSGKVGVLTPLGGCVDRRAGNSALPEQTLSLREGSVIFGPLHLRAPWPPQAPPGPRTPASPEQGPGSRLRARWPSRKGAPISWKRQKSKHGHFSTSGSAQALPHEIRLCTQRPCGHGSPLAPARLRAEGAGASGCEGAGTQELGGRCPSPWGCLWQGFPARGHEALVSLRPTSSPHTV